MDAQLLSVMKKYPMPIGKSCDCAKINSKFPTSTVRLRIILYFWKGGVVPFTRRKKIAQGIVWAKAFVSLREIQNLGFIDRLNSNKAAIIHDFKLPYEETLSASLQTMRTHKKRRLAYGRH